MLWVLGALIPGILAMTYVWGPGVLWNVFWLSLFCVVAEALCQILRGQRSLRALGHELGDCSALVTAWLMAICLPPTTALFILAVAALAAIGLAKHAYGGLGNNLFNPAMVGYAVVLVSFPEGLAVWPALADTATQTDALTGATPLSEFRYREGLTVVEFENQYAQTLAEQQIVSYAFLLGGASLLWGKLINWRMPGGIVLGLAIAALVGTDQGSSSSLGGWWFHVTSGGLVAAAFFVATDPVSQPKNLRHQLWTGVVLGILIYTIRSYGSYPDGIAFAVLLANCVTPLMNRWHNQQVAAGQSRAPT